MKKYIAIGHFKGSENMTSVAMKQNSIKEFRTDLIGNEFRAYIVLTEKKFESFRNKDYSESFEEVKKLTSNYRKWNDVVDYIGQCYDIMEEKLNDAI